MSCSWQNRFGELLETNGCRVTIKSESGATLKLFQQYFDKFDLLVTDRTRPRLIGLELPRVPTDQAGSAGNHCTRLSNAPSIADAQRQGILCLGKPIDSEVFLQSAGELLGIVG